MFLFLLCREIRQKNEPGVEFFWDEEIKNDYIALRINLPKHLDSSLIDVDVNPTYISIVIKSKLLKLRLPCEVKSSESSCKRSKLTGELVVKMPKVNPKETSIYVSTEAQKEVKAKGKGDIKSVSSSNKSSSSVTKSKTNIKMPSFANGIGDNDLIESSTTVFDCASDGSFDVSTTPSINPNTNNSRRVVRNRTTIKQPKKMSLQEEMMLASNEASVAEKLDNITLESHKNVGITELN